MARHNSKSNSAYTSLQNKSKCRRGSSALWLEHRADLIESAALLLLQLQVGEGTQRIFPCCSLSPGSLSLSLHLSFRSMVLGWFHSSLHCHPEQINVTMRKARAALFLRGANLLLESLSDLLYSSSSPPSTNSLGEKKTKKQHVYPLYFQLGKSQAYSAHCSS